LECRIINDTRFFHFRKFHEFKPFSHGDFNTVWQWCSKQNLIQYWTLFRNTKTLCQLITY
jgi:hypothetical protein